MADIAAVKPTTEYAVSLNTTKDEVVAKVLSAILYGVTRGMVNRSVSSDTGAQLLRDELHFDPPLANEPHYYYVNPLLMSGVKVAANGESAELGVREIRQLLASAAQFIKLYRTNQVEAALADKPEKLKTSVELLDRLAKNEELTVVRIDKVVDDIRDLQEVLGLAREKIGEETTGTEAAKAAEVSSGAANNSAVGTAAVAESTVVPSSQTIASAGSTRINVHLPGNAEAAGDRKPGNANESRNPQQTERYYQENQDQTLSPQQLVDDFAQYGTAYRLTAVRLNNILVQQMLAMRLRGLPGSLAEIEAIDPVAYRQLQMFVSRAVEQKLRKLTREQIIQLNSPGGFTSVVVPNILPSLLMEQGGQIGAVIEVFEGKYVEYLQAKRGMSAELAQQQVVSLKDSATLSAAVDRQKEQAKNAVSESDWQQTIVGLPFEQLQRATGQAKSLNESVAFSLLASCGVTNPAEQKWLLTTINIAKQKQIPLEMLADLSPQQFSELFGFSPKISPEQFEKLGAVLYELSERLGPEVKVFAQLNQKDWDANQYQLLIASQNAGLAATNQAIGGGQFTDLEAFDALYAASQLDLANEQIEQSLQAQLAAHFAQQLAAVQAADAALAALSAAEAQAYLQQMADLRWQYLAAHFAGVEEGGAEAAASAAPRPPAAGGPVVPAATGTAEEKEAAEAGKPSISEKAHGLMKKISMGVAADEAERKRQALLKGVGENAALSAVSAAGPAGTAAATVYRLIPEPVRKYLPIAGVTAVIGFISSMFSSGLTFISTLGGAGIGFLVGGPIGALVGGGFGWIGSQIAIHTGLGGALGNSIGLGGGGTTAGGAAANAAGVGGSNSSLGSRVGNFFRGGGAGGQHAGFFANGGSGLLLQAGTAGGSFLLIAAVSATTPAAFLPPPPPGGEGQVSVLPLTIKKQATPPSGVTTGQTITYTLTIRNNDNGAPVQGITIADNLDSEHIDPSSVKITDQGKSACNANGLAISCTSPDLHPHETTSVTYTAVAKNADDGKTPIKNLASVKGTLNGKEVTDNSQNVANSKGGLIAQYSLELVSGLERGYWGDYNYHPKYPQYFYLPLWQQMTGTDSPPCAGFSSCPQPDYPGPIQSLPNGSIALFWCTINVLVSYRQAGYTLPDLYGVEGMADYFKANGTYIGQMTTSDSPPNVKDIQVGDIAVFGTSSYPLFGHVAIVGIVTDSYITTYDSDNGDIKETYPVLADGSIGPLGSVHLTGVGRLP